MDNRAKGIGYGTSRRKYFGIYKRFLAIILVLVLAWGMLPAAAMADEVTVSAKTSDGAELTTNSELNAMLGEAVGSPVFTYEVPAGVQSVKLKCGTETLYNSGDVSNPAFEKDSDGYSVIPGNSVMSNAMLEYYSELDFNVLFGKTPGTCDYVLASSDFSSTIIMLCWEKPPVKAGLAEISATGAALYTPHPLNAEKYRLILDKGRTSGSFTFKVDENTACVYYSDSTYTAKGDMLSPSGGKYAVSFDSSEFTNAGNGEISMTRYIALATEAGNVTGFSVTAYRRTGAVDEPDSVADYLCIGSQYTNGGNTVAGTYGLYPENTLRGLGFWYSPTSVGNFGGYITYYYENAITNDSKNPYGIDFIVYGNSNGSQQFSEPGNVLISDDGKAWYTLAGSEHFEDATDWNYTVTYKKDADTGYTRVGDKVYEYFKYPSSDNYPLYSWQEGNDESITVSGVNLQGSGDSAAFPAWGYADVKVNCLGNWGTGSAGTVTGIARDPYWKQPSYPANSTSRPAETDRDKVNEYGGDGFDLAWTVGADGLPVRIDSIHYIKVQTASDMIAGAIGEKSTEVNVVARAVASDKDVGVTTTPASIMVDNNTIDLADGKHVYNATVSGVFDVAVTAGDDDNVYINNKRASYASFKDVSDHGIIRVIVQSGEKEPLIYYISVTDDGKSTDNRVTAITFDADGGKIGDFSTVTRYYDLNSSAVFPTPGREGYTFLGWYYGQKPYGSVSAEMPPALTLTAKWKSNDPGGIPAKNIPVSFRLIGATLSKGNIDLSKGDYQGSEYVTWIKTTSYSMAEGATVYDLFTRALNDAGLRNAGAGNNYVKTVYSPSASGGYPLSEFTNGRYSGWMYTVNGSHPAYGLKDYTLKAGDAVVWHYVNDYRHEVEDWFSEPGYPALGDGTYWSLWLNAKDVNPPSSATPSGGNTASASGALAPKATVANGLAKAEVSADQLADAITSAGKNNSAAIVIAPEITGDASMVIVELPVTSLSSIASGTDAGLTVQTPVGNVTLPNSALDSIAAQASGGTVTVSLGTVDTRTLPEDQQKTVGSGTVYDISVLSGGSRISGFGGGNITVSLPYALKNGEDPLGVTVWYLDDTGKLRQMTSAYDKTTGLATFATTHLSYYVVGYTAAWTNPFTDVRPTDWFYDAVKYAEKNELFSGMSDSTFAPDGNMTRAMLVTVLYRLEGKPAVTGANSFTDIRSGQWYTDAVAWASANRIVSGYGGGLFGASDNVTRGQMAAILYRYAQYKGYDVTKTTDLKAYTDAPYIAAWAVNAIKWANAEGLVTGATPATLSPADSASRAQVASILMRFCENIVK